MLKVRVKKVGAQIAAAGGMAAAVSAAGCADLETGAQPQPPSEEGVGEARALFFGGDVKFDISGWPGGPQSLDFVISAATTDEFLRVGQTLTFDLPAITLWDWLHPGAPTPTVDALQKLHATITVTAFDVTKVFFNAKAETVSFSGNDVFSLRALSSKVVIPAKADLVKFSMKIEDAADGSSMDIPQDQFVPLPVFGGALPDKTLLFDSTPAFRQRVIEGDDPVAGAALLFGYTDWRADTLVDASTIDRQIGTQVTSGRFGQVTVPLYGTIQHEITCAIQFDDGKGWLPEVSLDPNTASRLLPVGRTSYEREIAIPGKALHMALYVHVKTYLLANYPGGAGITKFYADGEKVLKAEKYDNPGDQAFANYEFSVEN